MSQGWGVQHGHVHLKWEVMVQTRSCLKDTLKGHNPAPPRVLGQKAIPGKNMQKR